MIKLNDVILLYIPKDLDGNKILDPIRNKQDLGTKKSPQAASDKINSYITNNVKFQVVQDSTDGKKTYGFTISINDLLALDLKVGAVNPQVLLNAIEEILLKPIVEADKFFDTSFTKPVLLDRSFLLPSDATEEEIQLSKPDPIGAVYNNFKVKSKFIKHVKEDYFQRFSANDFSVNAPQVPSFYQLIDTVLQKPEFKIQSGEPLKYGIVADTSNDHMAFYNYDTYKTFLAECEEIDSGRLKVLSLAHQTLPKAIRNQPNFPKLMADYFPFYITTEFSTERDQKNGFSFSSFLTNPDISPFFEQLISFYVDFSKNPSNYQNKPWVDNSEEYNIYTYKKAADPGTVATPPGAESEKVGEFQTRVIDVAEMIKDDVFFSNINLDNGLTAPCSAIKKKISTILFRTKIKELLTSVLDNNTDFWVNPNYSETICYRVTRTDKFTGKKFHWFVPNFSQLAEIKLFDSNGRFDRGQDIKYEVFALKATIGVNYKYTFNPAGQKKLDQILEAEIKPIYDEDGKLTNLDDLKNAPPNQFSDIPGILKYFDFVSSNTTVSELNNYFSDFSQNSLDDLGNQKSIDPIKLEFNVEAEPAVNFLEVPYLIKEKSNADEGVIIYDSPPAAPLIDLYPYRGVDNKLTAVFSGYVDQYIAKKQPILLGEENINNKTELYSRQYYKFAKDELYYKTEVEDIDSFEFMILETAPRKIEDFQEASVVRIKNTSDPVEISLLKDADLPYGTNYTINLQPNKDYWFVARVVDFSGNISDTSPVYKARIINDDGYINPTIGVFDMEAAALPKEVTTTPEFKKLLYIAPAPEHVGPYQKDENVKQIDVGLGTKQPYDKRYKVRLTSKTTNKKLEFNIFFEKDIKTISSKNDLPIGYKYQVVDTFADKQEIENQFDFEYGEIDTSAGYDGFEEAAKES